jgi:hypothetical protein
MSMNCIRGTDRAGGKFGFAASAALSPDFAVEIDQIDAQRILFESAEQFANDRLLASLETSALTAFRRHLKVWRENCVG